LCEVQLLRRLGDAALLHGEAESPQLGVTVMLVLAGQSGHEIIAISNGLN
jgi:hypothetical protein